MWWKLSQSQHISLDLIAWRDRLCGAACYFDYEWLVRDSVLQFEFSLNMISRRSEGFTWFVENIWRIWFLLFSIYYEFRLHCSAQPQFLLLNGCKDSIIPNIKKKLQLTLLQTHIQTSTCRHFPRFSYSLARCFFNSIIFDNFSFFILYPFFTLIKYKEI